MFNNPTQKNIRNFPQVNNNEQFSGPSGNCEIHHDEILTNFCTSLKCLTPLCPECIPDHYEKHAGENTKAMIISLKSAKLECSKKVKATITALNQEVENCELQYLMNPEETLKDRLNKIEDQKERCFHLVNSYFVQFEERLKAKVQENILKSQGIHSIKEEMNSLVTELNFLGTKLSSPDSLQIVKKICLLDTKKLFDKFKKDIHNAIDTRQLDPLDIKIDEQNGRNALMNALQTLIFLDEPSAESSNPRVKKLQANKTGNSLTNSKENFFKAPNSTNQLNHLVIAVPDYFQKNCQTPFLHFFNELDNTFNFYDIKSPKPHFTKVNLEQHSIVPNFHRSIILDSGEIFVIGGIDPLTSKKLDTICFLDPTKISIEVCAKMKTARSSHAICYVEPFIFIGGGISGDNHTLDSCEKFQVDDGSISEISPFKMAASSCTFVPFNKKAILKIGGADKNEKLCNVIELYDIATDKWDILRPKLLQNISLTITSNCAGAQLNEKDILVFGGYLSGKQQSSDSFVLSLNDKEWQIDRINEHSLPFAEGFWSNNPLVSNSRLWALQNRLEVNSKGELALLDRRLLEFDGLKWKKVI